MITNCHVPSLETLINQCCEDYYSGKGKTGEQIQQKQRGYYDSESFKQFIIDLHCQENLKFLVEIYQYEKIWNKVFKKKYSVLKCKSVSSNESGSAKRKGSVGGTGDFFRDERQNSNPSMISHGYDLDSADIERELHLTNEELSANWSMLFNKSFESEEVCDQPDGCLCETSDSLRTVNKSKIQVYLLNQLTLKFNDIIENFIKKNAAFEINLPTDIYDAIMKDVSDSRILHHSPSIFVKSKNHTLQLLRENIYFKFLKYEQQEFEKGFHSCNNNNNAKPVVQSCDDCKNHPACPLYSVIENESLPETATVTLSSSKVQPINSPTPIKARPQPMQNGSSGSTAGTIFSSLVSNSSSTSSPSTYNHQRHHFPYHHHKEIPGRSNSTESQTSSSSDKGNSGAEKIWKKIMKFKIGK